MSVITLNHYVGFDVLVCDGQQASTKFMLNTMFPNDNPDSETDGTLCKTGVKSESKYSQTNFILLKQFYKVFSEHMW